MSRLASWSFAVFAIFAAMTSIARAEESDSAVEGSYVGKMVVLGQWVDYGVKIAAQGGGKYHGVGYVGGLPGKGWDGQGIMEADGRDKNGGGAVFYLQGCTINVKNGAIDVVDPYGRACGSLKKLSQAAPNKPAEKSTAKPEAGADLAVQGEYVGRVVVAGRWSDFGTQIVSLGDGAFHGVGFVGGLPGEGWDGQGKMDADGQTSGRATMFELQGVTVRVQDGDMSATDGYGRNVGTLKKVERKSPTLGAKPPEGAVVLFDGKKTEELADARLTDDGLLMDGFSSKPKFQNFSLHLEFLIPFVSSARGGKRCESGCLIQGAHELKILDSFGLEPSSSECGAIRGVAAPLVNMTLPPSSWQTYDVDFTAAAQNGRRRSSPRMTVRHNGVVVQNNVTLPSAAVPEPTLLACANQGSPVRFRNIWVVERK